MCPDRRSLDSMLNLYHGDKKIGIDVCQNLLHPEIYVKTNDFNVFILYLLLCFYTHQEIILLLHYS